MISIIIVVNIFLLVSFWEFVRSFQLRGLYVRYAEGFAVFSIIGWIASFVALIKLYGAAIGIASFVGVIILLQYVTHFSVGLILNYLFRNSSDVPLAIHSILVWSLVLTTGILFAIGN